MARLQIIGGGKMGEALAGGLLTRAWATPEELTIVQKRVHCEQVLLEIIKSSRTERYSLLGPIDIWLKSVSIQLPV